MKKLLNREVVSYIVFGVAATVVNYVVFWLCYDLLFRQDHSLTANFFAFAAAVVFAYVTNKLFVFESKSWAWKVISHEIPEFLGARVFTFLVEEAGLFISDTLLGLGRYTLCRLGAFTLDGVMAVKIGLAAVTIALNYVFNIFIFKRQRN